MTLKKALISTFTVSALTLALWSSNRTQADPPPFQAVKSVFNSKCAVCHGTDGTANTAKGKELKVKDMRSAEVQGMSDDKLLEVIAKGKGKMLGYEKSLGKDKCQELVAYTRELGKKK